MSSDWRVSFPVVGAVLDANGKVALNPITETVPVREGYAKLTQVPNFDKTQASSVEIAGLTEISQGEPAADQYRVNYTTGRVHFHESRNNSVVSAAYYGKGTLVGVDEINWLWENVTRTTENLFYVALKDTPNFLIPRAVQVADKHGTRVEQMSPEIGRSHSSTVVLRKFPGTYRFAGSIFDWVTAWELTATASDTEVVDISVGHTDTLVFDAGRFSAVGADGRFYSTAHIFTPGARKMLRVTLPGSTGSVGILVAVSGVYYRYVGGAWAKIGTLNAVRSLPLAEWNTPVEYESIPQRALEFLQDNALNFAVYCADGGSFKPEVHIVTNAGFEYTRAVFAAKFDKSNGEWEITMPAGKDYAVIIGSGKDDMSCTSEVVEFADVLPNETVAVKAPVRTNINVLMGTDTVHASYKFPVADTRQWVAHAWAEKTLELGQFRGEDGVFTSTFSSLDAISAFDILGDTVMAGSIICAAALSGAQNVLNNGVEVTTQHGKLSYGPGGIGAAFMAAPAGYFAFKAGLSTRTVTSKTFPYSLVTLFDKPKGAKGTILEGEQHPTNEVLTQLLVVDNGLIRLIARRKDGWQVTVGTINAPLMKNSNCIVVTDIYYRHWASSGTGFMQMSASVWVNGKKYSLSRSTSIAYDGGWNGSNGISPLVGIGGAYSEPSTPTHLAAYIPKVLTDGEVAGITAALLPLGRAGKAAMLGNTYAYVTPSTLPDSATGKAVVVSEPEAWSRFGNAVLYAFMRGGEITSVSKDTYTVSTITPGTSYAALQRLCADITTLRHVMSSGRYESILRGASLVCIVRDGGLEGDAPAVPGQLTVLDYTADSGVYLAGHESARVKYADGEWRVTNTTNKATTLRLAILGGGVLDQDNIPQQVKFFTELLDTPSDLNDLAPKALVSHNGSVAKALHVHPYLLGEI